MGTFKVLVLLLLVTFEQVSCQVRWFSPKIVSEGDTAIMTCNFEAILDAADPDLGQTVTAVSSLVISWLNPNTRQVEQIGKIERPGGPGIAEYNQFTNNGRMTIFGADIQDEGGFIAGNRDKVYLQLTISDVTCQDQTTYICQLNPYSETTAVNPVTASANLTVPVYSTEVVAVTQPDNFEYEENANVTFSCRSDGPENIEILWAYKTCPENSDNPSFNTNQGFQYWPFASDIVNDNLQTVTSSAGCARSRLKSSLRNVQLNAVGMSRNERLCDIKCEVGARDGTFVEHRQWNRTISYSKATPGTLTSSSGSSDNAGVIAGAVIGSIAFIVLVCVLVYFFWYRKRSKEDDYREDDKPDAYSGEAPPAVPPVFYTKPEKGSKDDRGDKTVVGVHNNALDTSYDSRDSANRGPPQYANTPDFPDNTAPPFYEKENRQGKPNRSFDEDRNGDTGRKYTRNDDGRRDQSRKGNRGRDPRDDPRDDPRSRYDDRYGRDPRDRYDEEAPRSRRYSNEDGTDHIPFNYGGDPNMGTAI